MRNVMARTVNRYLSLFLSFFLIIGLVLLSSSAYPQGVFSTNFTLQDGDAFIAISGDAQGVSAEDQPLNAFQDRVVGVGRFLDGQGSVSTELSGQGFTAAIDYTGLDSSLIRNGEWQASGGVTRINSTSCLFDAIDVGVKGIDFTANTQVAGCPSGVGAGINVTDLVGEAHLDRMSASREAVMDEEGTVLSDIVSRERQTVRVGGLLDVVNVFNASYIPDCSTTPAGEDPWWPPMLCDPERTDPDLHLEPWPPSLPTALQLNGEGE